MKTRDIEKQLQSLGYYFLRNSSHKMYTNGITNIAVPHHVEINKFLAKKILKQAELGLRKVA